MKATIFVFSLTSTFPLLTSTVPFSLLSAAVVGRNQSLLLLLYPPNSTSPSRWLPSSLSIFRDVTLGLQLTIRCPTDESATSDVSVVVPCPGQVQPLASEVKSLSIVAQYSALFSVPATGGAVGRMLSVRHLALCDGSDVTEGMLPLVVDGCDETSDSLSTARGAILGNLVLWAAGCMLIMVVVFAYAWLGRTSILLAVEALGVPSPLFPLVVMTIPSTASGAFYLFHSSRCGVDDAVAAVGLVMCLVPLVVLLVVALEVPRRLTLGVNHRPTTVPMPITDMLFHRRVRWHEPERSGDMSLSHLHVQRPNWRRIASVILLDFAVLWYACADVAVLTATSFLGAVGVLESEGACRGSAITVFLLYVTQLVLCCWARPFTTLFSNVYAALTLLLSSIAVTCEVCFLIGTAASVDGQAQLQTAAAVCDLAVSGVSMLKTVLDVFEALRACRHIMTLLRRHRKISAALDVNGSEFILNDEVMSVTQMTELENKIVSKFGIALVEEVDEVAYDDMFWNADGTAVRRHDANGIATAEELLVDDQQERWDLL